MFPPPPSYKPSVRPQRIAAYVGVDPGRTGAIAEICRGEVRVWKMPESEQRGIDVRATSDILDQLTHGAVVGLEWNTARPSEVPDFAFRFGLQTGQLDALFYAKGFEVKRISSNLWTGRLGLPGKTHFGAIPQRAAMFDTLFPNYAAIVRGPRGGLLDGVLDAVLIAHWISLVQNSPVGSKGGPRPPRHLGV